jgi:hypothetical protein
MSDQDIFGLQFLLSLVALDVTVGLLPSRCRRSSRALPRTET